MPACGYDTTGCENVSGLVEGSLMAASAPRVRKMCGFIVILLLVACKRLNIGFSSIVSSRDSPILVGWDFRGRTAFIEFWQDIFSQSQDVTRPNKDLMKFLSDVLTLQVLLMNFSRYNP